MVRCSRFRSARSGSQVLPFPISKYNTGSNPGGTAEQRLRRWVDQANRTSSEASSGQRPICVCPARTALPPPQMRNDGSGDPPTPGCPLARS